MNPEQFIIIPILGILAGIIIPISVFIWQYYDHKSKREAIIEIVKHLNNPSKLDELLTIFDERKKEPIDYRRSGVISIFVGAWSIYIRLLFNTHPKRRRSFSRVNRGGYNDCWIFISKYRKRVD